MLLVACLIVFICLMFRISSWACQVKCWTSISYVLRVSYTHGLFFWSPIQQMENCLCFCHISWSLEAARLGGGIIISFWNLSAVWSADQISEQCKIGTQNGQYFSDKKKEFLPKIHPWLRNLGSKSDPWEWPTPNDTSVHMVGARLLHIPSSL